MDMMADNVAMWGTKCLQVPRSSNIKMSFAVTSFPIVTGQKSINVLTRTGGNGLGQETS